MANGTVKKIGKAAGQKDVDTEIRVLEVVQQVRGKSDAEWNLEAKGKLHKSVMENLVNQKGVEDKGNYLSIKAYNNEKTKSKNSKDKEITD